MAAPGVPFVRGAGDVDHPGLVRRWAGVVTRHAVVALTLALAALVVLAVPVLKGDLRLGPLDNSLFPTDSTQYRAWELETDAFGPGSTDPLPGTAKRPTLIPRHRLLR